jgi:hypothetical protein
MDNEAEVYKITAVDDMGNSIEAYIKPENKEAYVRQMSSEYGNLEIVSMTLAEVPEDVEL